MSRVTGDAWTAASGPWRRLDRVDAWAIAPALVALAAVTFLAAKDGGFPATSGYPFALYSLLLLAAVVFGGGGRNLTLTRTQGIAAGALVAFTVWSYLSIAWAQSKGDAWDGANRTALYLVVFVLFAILPWRARSALIVLGVYAIATTALAAGVLVHVATVGNPQPDFIGTRLSAPTGYQNATAELFMAPVWAALVLAGRREVPALVRGVMLAAAGLLVDLAILGQSRGWLYATPVAVIVFLLLVPRRLRSILALALVSAATALLWPRLLDVYDARGAAGLHRTMHALLVPVALASVALFVIGLGWSLTDRRLRPSERFELWAGRIVGIAAVVSVLVAVPLAFTHWNASRHISHAWHEFTSKTPSSTASSHFSSGLGGGRYDFWRVAVDEFKAHPVGGIGADNFALGYVKHRHVEEEPAYPHSVELRTLAGTGAVGSAFFVIFLGAALAAAIGAARRAGPRSPGRIAVATAVSVFAYWWIHGSVDWFWEFPALSAPAVALLAVAGRVSPAPLRSSRPSSVSRPWVRRGLALTASFGGLFLAASMILPWLAAHDVAVASGNWRADPTAAFDRLDRARRLNFLSDRPDLSAGAIATRTGRWDVARRSFEGAISRNDENWYPYLELAVLDALQGRKSAAVRELDRVRELNPLEPTTDLILRRMGSGRPLRFDELDQIFLARVRHRLS
jgi:hypothetical protein